MEPSFREANSAIFSTSAVNSIKPDPCRKDQPLVAPIMPKKHIRKKRARIEKLSLNSFLSPKNAKKVNKWLKRPFFSKPGGSTSYFTQAVY